MKFNLSVSSLSMLVACATVYSFSASAQVAGAVNSDVSVAPSAATTTTTANQAAENKTDSKTGTSLADMPPELRILKSIEVEIKKKKGSEIYERSSVPSLVFTPSQYALLREARIGFNTRAPTLQELAKAGDPNDPNYRPPVSIRDVRLTGIAYNTPDDWTIWLNNARVTPDAIPAEAVDLRVYKDFIELKWFDALTSQIFPVRLRMNQKFNLDTRIFLPAL